MDTKKNKINLNFGNINTPTVSEELKSLTEEQRFMKIINIIQALNMHSFDTKWFEIVSWEPANQITVCLLNQDPANVRGTNLLKLENLLKEIVDPAIEVYLQAKEDKNKLRKFRGVQIAAH
jgi:hypothetical protein